MTGLKGELLSFSVSQEQVIHIFERRAIPDLFTTDMLNIVTYVTCHWHKIDV